MATRNGAAHRLGADMLEGVGESQGSEDIFEDFVTLREFLRTTILDDKGRETGKTNSIAIRFECDGYAATVNDAKHARQCVLALTDLGCALQEINDVLGCGKRVAWRPAKWLRK